MGHSPVVLFGVSGEQAVMDTISDLLQRARDSFGEAAFIADLIQQFVTRDDDTLLSAKGELVYRACGDNSISAGLHAANRSAVPIPYISAKCIKLAIEFSGSTSLILPKRGKPGGVGIGVPITQAT